MATRRRPVSEDEIQLVPENDDSPPSSDVSPNADNAYPRVKEEKHIIPIPLSRLALKQKLSFWRSERGKQVAWWITVGTLGFFSLLAVLIPLVVWENTDKQSCLDYEDVALEDLEQFPFIFRRISGEFYLCRESEAKLAATLGVNVNGEKVKEVRVDLYQYNEDTWLNISRRDNDKHCLRIEWVAEASLETPLMDCFSMKDIHWYGAYERHDQQWPLSIQDMDAKPFLPHDYLSDDDDKEAFGPILHPIWLSSTGAAIMVDDKIQLHVSMNGSESKLCLSARPFELDCTPHALEQTFLNYTLCIFDNVTETVQYFLNNSRIPSTMPDRELFRKPIWSTWAKYKTNVSETSLTEFYGDITGNNFGISQLEIDDGYSANYGDLSFNNISRSFLAELSRSVNLSAWVHPFVSYNAADFESGIANGHFLPGISRIEGNSVSLVKWWHGYASVLNFLSNETHGWHSERLDDFVDEYSLTSLKFDAGEVTYLPRCVYIEGLNHLGDYAKAYAQFVSSRSYSPRTEVRVGYYTQELGLLVRLLDRSSLWTRENGLRSVLGAVLAIGVAGYPYIMPDMIGGNGVTGTDLMHTELPSLELYVRWLQLSTFLPVMQFSIAPWQYGDATLLEHARSLTELHLQYSDYFIELAEDAMTTGFPIIRPLWWIATWDEPYSSCVWTADGQFLIGDQYLVAPVLEEGATNITVCIPQGTRWKAISPERYSQTMYDTTFQFSDVTLWDVFVFEVVR